MVLQCSGWKGSGRTYDGCSRLAKFLKQVDKADLDRAGFTNSKAHIIDKQAGFSPLSARYLDLVQLYLKSSCNDLFYDCKPCHELFPSPSTLHRTVVITQMLIFVFYTVESLFKWGKHSFGKLSLN